MDTAHHIASVHFPNDLIVDEDDRSANTRTFGIQTTDGVVRVSATTYGVPPGGTWWLQVTVGLGFEVRDIDAAMRWVNQKNAESVVGLYYVSIAHHGEYCAIMWETLIWNGLLNGLVGPGADVVMRWIGQVLLNAQHRSSQLPTELRAALGGRPCPPGEQGLMWILGNLT